MSYAASDTIIAIATAQAYASVGIIRISGPSAKQILQRFSYLFLAKA